MTTCPKCNGQTFVGNDTCDACGKTLMVLCQNKKNCGKHQFFENKKCTLCGKPIKNASEQIKKQMKEE